MAETKRRKPATRGRTTPARPATARPAAPARTRSATAPQTTPGPAAAAPQLANTSTSPVVPAGTTPIATTTYAQLKRTALDNAQGTPLDTNDAASTLAAIASADNSTFPVSRDGVQQAQVQGFQSFPSFQSGAFKAFVSTATSPAPSGGGAGVVGGAAGGGAGSAEVNQAIVHSAQQATSAVNAIASTKAQSDCAFSINPFSGGLFGDIAGHPSWCVLSWSQVRALLGAGILVGGVAVLAFGVGTLLGTTAAAGRVGMAVLGAIPGGGAVKAAGGAAQKAAPKSKPAPSPSGRAPKPVAGAGPLSGKRNTPPEPRPTRYPRPKTGGRTQQGTQSGRRVEP